MRPRYIKIDFEPYNKSYTFNPSNRMPFVVYVKDHFWDNWHQHSLHQDMMSAEMEAQKLKELKLPRKY